MSLSAIIIYEIVYGIIYFGLLLSKSTFLQYFPHSSILVRLLFLIILFSGFFLPYYLKILHIQLKGKHYLIFVIFLLLSYILASRYYYSGVLKVKRFHSFLQVHPTEQKVQVPKPKDVFRILCLGGSTTEEGRLTNESYPDFLKELLRKKYPKKKIEVINAGKYFYNTQHSIIQYLFYLKELKPDLIIFFHGVNDLITSFTTPPYSSSPFRKDYGHFYGALARIVYPTKFEEFLLRFFYADLRKPELIPVSFSDWKSLYSFRRNLETFIEITQNEGIALILSNQAHCFSEKNTSRPDFLLFIRDFLIDKKHYADEKSWYEGINLFNQVTRETAEKFSIPFVDQAAVFKGRRNLFTDAFHMKIEGRKIKARLFFEKIVQTGLIK